MKKIIACLLGLFLLSGAACGESSSPELSLLPAEKAQIRPVCQDVEQIESSVITRTGYEVTVPICLPVCIRVAQDGGAGQEITLNLPVGQITYYMETAFDGTNLCGGAHDPLRYPMLDWLGSPPYPGGPYLERGVLPRELLSGTRYEIVQKPAEFKAMRSGDMFALSFSGGLLRVTYSGLLTIDPYGNLISAEPVTRELPFDYSQVFQADAPEYTGELALPTYAEWIGVPDAPR